MYRKMTTVILKLVAGKGSPPRQILNTLQSQSLATNKSRETGWRLMNPEAGGRWGRRRGSGAVGAGTGEWGGGGAASRGGGALMRQQRGGQGGSGGHWLAVGSLWKTILSMSFGANVTILRKLLNRLLKHYVIFWVSIWVWEMAKVRFHCLYDTTSPSTLPTVRVPTSITEKYAWWHIVQ